MSNKKDNLLTSSKARDAISKKIKETLKEGGEDYVEVLEPVLASLVGLVQIATAGRVESVQDLLENPNNFVDKLLDSDKSLLTAFLQAQSLAGAMTPVDPQYKQSHNSKIAYMKLLKELIEYEENRKLTKSRTFEPGPTTGEAARYSNILLQELDDAGEKTGQEGD